MKLEQLTKQYDKVSDRNDQRKDELFSAYAKTKTDLGYSNKDLKDPKNITKFVNAFYKTLGIEDDSVESQLDQKTKYGFTKNELLEVASQEDNIGYDIFLGIMQQYSTNTVKQEKDLVMGQFNQYNIGDLKELIEQDSNVISMDVYKAGLKKSRNMLSKIVDKTYTRKDAEESPYVTSNVISMGEYKAGKDAKEAPYTALEEAV